MIRPGPRSVQELKTGGKTALSRALTAIETEGGSERLARFLDEVWNSSQFSSDVWGVTGPPGVGKSTLINAMIQNCRERGEQVGVIAVDPSSRYSGGALLGDRTRLTSAQGEGVFIRSMAARDRLGGLSDQALAAIVIMRAVMDRVIVESVGVGQSESDVAFAVDTTILCVQPGAGDSLQFMKAGVMETPDVIVITKADMVASARRAQADVEGALSLSPPQGREALPKVLLASAGAPCGSQGVDELVETCRCDTGQERGKGSAGLRRKQQASFWVRDAVRLEFGTAGVGLCDIDKAIETRGGPFLATYDLQNALRAKLGMQAVLS